jgi:alpha-tubulin suppressor-like RCC1 family protein
VDVPRSSASRSRVPLIAALVTAVLATSGVSATAAGTSPAAKPSITSLTVTSGPSTGGTRLTVKGTNLAHVTTVSFGGLKGTKLKVSATHKSLQINAPAHISGVIDLRVTSTLGTSAVTSRDRYTYRTYTSLSAGRLHTCAIIGGVVRCWGYNARGQLGNGTTTDAHAPIAVSGLTHVVAISGGGTHTCALRDDGTVRCWGYNFSGQLGNNTTTDSHVPITVPNLNHVVAISAGDVHTCAVIDDGTARCWGYNDNGQLGNSTTTDSHTPVTVRGLTHAVAISAGEESTCALRADGTARCWGLNDSGQLGNGTLVDAHTPVPVHGVTHAISLTTGKWHACAVVSGGVVRCWGYDQDGELGDGSVDYEDTAVPVAGLTGASVVSAGEEHTCALVRGHAFCWGDGLHGALGDGALESVPVLNPGAVALAAARDISAGGEHSCGRLATGALLCWGSNNLGQLGNGTTTQSPLPVPVSG